MRFSSASDRKLVLTEARHPLLADVLRRQNKPVVPISLALDESHRTLLISGPNTGGKTVALKSVGLAALSAQSDDDDLPGRGRSGYLRPRT